MINCSTCKFNENGNCDQFKCRDYSKWVSRSGTKNDTNKPPISLLDRDFLEGAAQVMAFGANKYDRYNWTLGIKYSRLIDAAMRHIIAYYSGEDIDPESGLPHIDHAAANLNMLRGMMRLHPEMDDRYGKGVSP